MILIKNNFHCVVWLWVLAHRNTKPDSFRDRVWFCETFALQLDRTNHNKSWGRCWASNAGGLMASLFFFLFVFLLHTCLPTFSKLSASFSWCEHHRLLLDTKSLREVCLSVVHSLKVSGTFKPLNLYQTATFSGCLERCGWEELRSAESGPFRSSQLHPVTQSQVEENWPEVSEGTLGEMQLWN